MTIEEAGKAKRELEEMILSEIRRFEEESTLSVAHITLERIERIGSRSAQCDGVDITVTL